MKLSEMAQELSISILDFFYEQVPTTFTVQVEPIMTKKEAATYGRADDWDRDNIFVRFFVDTKTTGVPDLDQMELFIPVSKKRLKESPRSVAESVMRFIMQATQYRHEMLVRAAKRRAA